jgi:hypothetical protein
MTKENPEKPALSQQPALSPPPSFLDGRMPTSELLGAECRRVSDEPCLFIHDSTIVNGQMTVL